jgi:hypothetical protein
MREKSSVTCNKGAALVFYLPSAQSQANQEEGNELKMLDLLKKTVLWIRKGFNADPDTDSDPAFFVHADPDPDPGF